jgi:hypothetical protein
MDVAAISMLASTTRRRRMANWRRVLRPRTPCWSMMAEKARARAPAAMEWALALFFLHGGVTPARAQVRWRARGCLLQQSEPAIVGVMGQDPISSHSSRRQPLPPPPSSTAARSPSTTAAATLAARQGHGSARHRCAATIFCEGEDGSGRLRWEEEKKKRRGRFGLPMSLVCSAS